MTNRIHLFPLQPANGALLAQAYVDGSQSPPCTLRAWLTAAESKGWQCEVHPDATAAHLATRADAGIDPLPAPSPVLDILQRIVNAAYKPAGPHQDFHVHPGLIDQARALLAETPPKPAPSFAPIAPLPDANGPENALAESVRELAAQHRDLLTEYGQAFQWGSLPIDKARELLDRTTTMHGAAVLARSADSIFLRIPDSLAEPIKGGCGCDYCKANPRQVPKWDALCIPATEPKKGVDYAAHVHMPDASQHRKHYKQGTDAIRRDAAAMAAGAREELTTAALVARETLAVLQGSPEWNSDTLDAIAQNAYCRNLADSGADETSHFRALV